MQSKGLGVTKPPRKDVHVLIKIVVHPTGSKLMEVKAGQEKSKQEAKNGGFRLGFIFALGPDPRSLWVFQNRQKHLTVCRFDSFAPGDKA